MRRLILAAVLMAATAIPAAALSKAEWDLQFVKGLGQRGYLDLADEQAARTLEELVEGADAAKALLELARIYLNLATESTESQQELVDKAKVFLDAAANADPEIAKQTEYRAEAVVLNQRVGSILAQKLPEVEGARKEKLLKEIDDTFARVKGQFQQIIKDAQRVLDDLYEKDPDTTPDLEAMIDEVFMQISIHKLREAMACYAHLETYDTRREDPGRATLLEVTLQKLEEVAWEGEGSSIFLYAMYYKGMAHKKEKDYQKAAEAFKAALEQPKEIQVPEIVARPYLEYADTLINTNDFREANRILNEFRRRDHLIAGNEARAEMYRAVALFSWAYHIKVHNPDNEAAISERTDEAMKICRRVTREYPRWEGTVNEIMTERLGKIREGTSERDPTVLTARLQVLYGDKKYAEAAAVCQQLSALTKAPDETRVRAGWYLVMCYYRQEQYYEAAASADFLTLRFDPQKYEHSDRALKVGITSLQELYQKTKDPFDKELYIEFRKKLGEDEFKLFEADNFKGQKQYGKALEKLAEISPDSEAYPMALFMTAECTDLLGDSLWKQKKRQEGLGYQIKAVKLYREFLDWSAGNPAEGDAAAERSDIEARAIFKLQHLLTGTPGTIGTRVESYYEVVIKNLRTDKAALADMIGNAARGMLQPVPEKKPTSRQQALVMLQGMVAAKNRYSLELTADFPARYSKSTVVFPYVHYLRITAALILGETETAEDDLLELKKYPEFGKRMARVYGSMASTFDAKAKELEEEEKATEAQAAYDKALVYYQEMIKADPDQELGMLHYIILLMHKRGPKVALNAKLELVKGFMDKFEKQPGHEEEIDRIKAVQADLFFEHGDHADALKLYDELITRFDKEYEEKKQSNPRLGRSPLHWEVMLSHAKTLKALKKYEEAAQRFIVIRKNVPEGGETWWKATYDVVDCLIELKMHDKAMRTINIVYELHTNLGGDTTRGNFLLLLAKLVNVGDDGIRSEAQSLIKRIENHNKEAQ